MIFVGTEFKTFVTDAFQGTLNTWGLLTSMWWYSLSLSLSLCLWTGQWSAQPQPCVWGGWKTSWYPQNVGRWRYVSKDNMYLKEKLQLITEFPSKQCQQCWTVLTAMTARCVADLACLTIPTLCIQEKTLSPSILLLPNRHTFHP